MFGLVNTPWSSPSPYWLLIIHCIIGVGAAIVAEQKGFNPSCWLAFGPIGGTAALIAALVTKPKV